MAVDSGQGPGRPGQGRRGEGPAGRGGGRGDRGGPGGRGGRDRGDRKGGSGGAGGRVVPELSVLEKALAKVDFASEIQPLDAVVKVLRQAHARSLQDLDMDTRGRLITTLSRVARQTRPAPDPETPAAPEADAGPAAVPGGDEQAASPSVPPEPVAESPGTGEGSPPPEAEAAEAAPAAAIRSPLRPSRRPTLRAAAREAAPPETGRDRAIRLRGIDDARAGVHRGALPRRPGVGGGGRARAGGHRLRVGWPPAVPVRAACRRERGQRSRRPRPGPVDRPARVDVNAPSAPSAESGASDPDAPSAALAPSAPAGRQPVAPRWRSRPSWRATGRPRPSSSSPAAAPATPRDCTTSTAASPTPRGCSRPGAICAPRCARRSRRRTSTVDGGWRRSCRPRRPRPRWRRPRPGSS